MENLISLIKSRKIVITANINAAEETVYWVAGFKTAFPGSDKGLVKTDDFALGKTLEEAVEKLLKGQTAFRWEESGYVEHEFVRNGKIYSV